MKLPPSRRDERRALGKTPERPAEFHGDAKRELLEAHGVDGRQVAGDACPLVAPVVARPKGACRAPECEVLAACVDVERVAVNDVVRMRLRQAARQHLPRLARVARARDDHARVDGNAYRILARRHQPGGVAVVRVHGDGEAKDRGADALDVDPRSPAIVRPEDSVVVLRPEAIRAPATLNDAVRVLNRFVFSSLRRHVLCEHPSTRERPRLAAVIRQPGAAARHPNVYSAGVRRVHAHGMDGR